MSKIYFAVYVRKTMEVIGYTYDEEVAISWLSQKDDDGLPVYDYQWHEEEGM